MQAAIHSDSMHTARGIARDWIFAAPSIIMDSYIRATSMEALLWLLLEAGVALLLLVLIVWWTWPRGQKTNAPRDDDAGR